VGLNGPSLLLTNEGRYEAGSAFFATPVNIQSFTTNFIFQITNPAGDGFTFTIQNAGPTALGGDGGGLGFSGVPNSVAMKFDLYDDAGEGANSTGLFTFGNMPAVPSLNLSITGINLHSGDPMNVHMTYDTANSGGELTMNVTDLKSGATWSNSFAVDIAGTVGGPTAYVGFTGSTGKATSTQAITSWTYQTGP